MPFLDWVNKNQAVAGTKSVPYHLLKREKTYGSASENLLIQGDNLLALKALKPFYAGQVKCIFIDPPYNTQSAFEHYDDKLEHSQWLSMMYSRLSLLRELLSADGSIWIAIDDREGHYLKVLMDEIFGRDAFVTTVVWQSRYSRSSDTAISLSHNFIHCYAMNPGKWKNVRNRLERTPLQEKQFNNPDNDVRGPWRAIPWDAPNIRENLSYPITTPAGNVRFPPAGRCWSRTEEQWNGMVASGLAYFGKKGDGAPSFKQYLSESPPIVPNTWWGHEEAGHTDEAKKEIITLFGKEDAFATPKPERLLQRIIHIATNPSDLVLDSFLGSGTTAAVAHKMGRRYIGIEMGDHAMTHCVPRLEKVIDGEQGGISKAVEWAGGGGFSFCTLSSPAFDQQGQINPELKFPDLASFVWHLETGLPGNLKFETPLLGAHNGTAYYLLYNGILGDKRPLGGNVLNNQVLKAIHDIFPFDGPKVIYGEAVRLGANKLDAESIVFKQIPYDINLV